MSSNTAFAAMNGANDAIATLTTPTSLAEAQATIPGLPNHLVVEHILRSEYFVDPADLARLPSVSRAMRDAVAATGLRFGELHELQAVHLGCVRAVQRLQWRDLLSEQEYLCQVLARGGHLEELKEFLRKGAPCYEDMFSLAAEGGNLEMLQWARANGCPLDSSDPIMCRLAAESENLDMLQWVRANGCVWGEATCARAAQGGYLEVLKWAHENGCPWSDRTCMAAAEFGHLEVLQLLHENGCPWKEETCAMASSSGKSK